MQSLVDLVLDPQLVRVECVVSEVDRVVLAITTIRPQVPCPDCRRPATRVHSCYGRRVADLP